MIVALVAEPGEEAKAIGGFGFVGAAGASTGLVLGGVLTQAVSWQAIFFVNVPIGILAGLSVIRVLAADRGTGLHDGAGWPGAFLVTAGLMPAVSPIVGTARYGWGSAPTVLAAAPAGPVLPAFVSPHRAPRPPP